MRGHDLIFSRNWDGVERYRVSPFLFPQFGLKNKFFVPSERDLPSDGLSFRWWVFDFGFTNPGNIIPPYGVVYAGLPAGRNFLVFSLTGASVPQGAQGAAAPATAGQPGAQVSPAFQINFLHTHEGVQRQWAQKNLTDMVAVGRGTYPLVLKNPALILKGDTLTCQLVNLSNCNLLAQVVLAGGEF
jgi:hypothetical protein